MITSISFGQLATGPEDEAAAEQETDYAKSRLHAAAGIR
jgi:hypothetical protein